MTDPDEPLESGGEWGPPAWNLPPFNPRGTSESHTLYIEAQDNISQISLAVVQFTV
jgi:hypothetical protein